MKALLDIESLSVDFMLRRGWLHKPQRLHALQGLSLRVAKGEILGIAGESGCGKTTLLRCILGLIQPKSGTISFNGHRIGSKGKDAHLHHDIQYIFQNPYSCLNPKLTIRYMLEEAIQARKQLDALSLAKRLHHICTSTQIDPHTLDRYPKAFSGGQRQRIAIARALCTQPQLILADEPTCALDVFAQAQILSLFAQLRQALGLSIILVSHNLAILGQIADRLAIIHEGCLVEIGAAKTVLTQPQHPYTQMLCQSVPQWSR